MKQYLMALAALVGMAASGTAAITTAYVDLEDFTDFSISGRSEENAKAVFEKELERHRRLHKAVGENRTLELTFTDIDMAGDIQPWRNRNFADIRYIKSVYPPRMAFSYVLRDADGKEIASGTEKISDLGFDFRVRSTRHSDTFYYELEMLEDWARKTLPRP